MLVSGFNEAVAVAGVVFHVQTQHHESFDRDVIETQVFRDGKIVLRRRYEPPAGHNGDRVRHLTDHLQRYHRSVIHQLIRAPSRRGQTRKAPVSAREWRRLRRLIARLQRSVGTKPPEEDLRQRMHAIASALAVITGHPSTRRLRNHDLGELSSFRDEAQKLVRGEELDPGHCLDLWRRLVVITFRLGRINARREVIEHDVELCRRLLAESDGANAGRRLLSGELLELRKLLGRDSDLDSQLDRPGELVVGLVRTELSRILEEIQGAATAGG